VGTEDRQAGWQPWPSGLRGQGVRGDEGKLRQALINLLGNAVKFTEQGGVTLRVSWRGGDSALTDHPSRYLFEVLDTGPGIGPELQARLFQPFQQGDSPGGKGGTGLGQAITRRLAEAMGGRVGVESRVGQGSRFWFEVPLRIPEGEPEEPEHRRADARTPLDAAAPRRRLAPGVTVRALVVDDIHENREILSELLRQMGCEVETAAGGIEAIDRVKRQVPDIVFLDIRMPGMDGMETLARLQVEWPPGQGAEAAMSTGPEGARTPPRRRPRIVAVSASVLGHERARCLAAGFDAFLGKPFLAAELVELLERLLAVTWDAATSDAVESDRLSVPAELLERLKSSARGYRVTELKQRLLELEKLGPAGAALATRLRRLAQFSRMSEAIALIEEVQSRGP
jgi:CheY-like chemotaxis protein